MSRQLSWDVDHGIALYQEGVSMTVLASLFGISLASVQYSFNKRGVKRRPASLAVSMGRHKASREQAEQAFRARGRKTVAAVRSEGMALPAWVPADLRADYVYLTRSYGEERAASEVRKMKREAA